jgi:hypothetical protein
MKSKNCAKFAAGVLILSGLSGLTAGGILAEKGITSGVKANGSYYSYEQFGQKMKDKYVTGLGRSFAGLAIMGLGLVVGNAGCNLLDRTRSRV